MNLNQNTQGFIHCHPWLDDYGIRRLLCALIETAVEDYRIAAEHGMIVNGVIIHSKVQKLKNMDHISELTSLISFFHGNGLEMVIEAGALQDNEGNSLDSSAILSAL